MKLRGSGQRSREERELKRQSPEPIGRADGDGRERVRVGEHEDKVIKKSPQSIFNEVPEPNQVDLLPLQLLEDDEERDYFTWYEMLRTFELREPRLGAGHIWMEKLHFLLHVLNISTAESSEPVCYTLVKPKHSAP